MSKMGAMLPSQLIVYYLSTLDLSPGANLEDVRQSFKELSFIWHPDRQPERMRLRAEKKIKALSVAYEYFCFNPSFLDEVGTQELVDAEAASEHPPLPPSGDTYTVNQRTCPRCGGSGQTALTVDANGSDIHGTCPICQGEGFLLVDDRNLCRTCDGNGKNPGLSDEDILALLAEELDRYPLMTSEQRRIRHRKLWIRQQNGQGLCASCHGSGFFYYRTNHRSKSHNDTFAFQYQHPSETWSDKRTGS